MKSKGFTLVELLAVIILLAIISTITIISVTSTINDSKKSLNNTQLKEIEKAAEQYYIGESIVPNDYCINLSELISAGYLENNQIKNLITNEDLNGSVLVSYNNNQYTYTYNEFACDVKLCNKVTSSKIGNIPTGQYNAGDEYTCQVNDTTTYNFYVLSTEGDKVNLIMDHNICRDGSIAYDSSCNVAWYNSYYDYNTYATSADVEINIESEESIEAISYLNEATSSWNKISSLNESFDSGYGIITLTGKARLPKFKEVANYTSSEKPYLYANLENGYENIDGVIGYHTLSNISDHHSGVVSFNVSQVNVFYGSFYGVRPVITLNKYQLN